MTDQVKKYLSSIGRRGGQATGPAKLRGDAEYYRQISKKAVAARKRKQAAAALQGATNG